MVGSLKHFAAAAVKSLQSCPTLSDPIDGSPPGSSVHVILQARILEWVAVSVFIRTFYVDILFFCVFSSLKINN